MCVGYLTPLCGNISPRLRTFLRTGPCPCVVQKIIIGIIQHTLRAKVNHLPASDMTDNQQPQYVLVTAKAFVRNVTGMKTITISIMVIHIICLNVF